MRILTLILGAILSTTGGAATPQLAGEIEVDINRLLERQRARAVVVALYDNGATSVVGFGQISGADEKTPNADTLFEIGSISKVFTSLLVQVQVDNERLNWDQTLQASLPKAKFASPAIGRITLRELSTHTSGLPRLPHNFDMQDPMDPYAGYERSDLMHFLTTFDPDSLEKAYAYSNLGAGLLGVIAADAAGASYAQAMRRDVLLPLGLEDTAVSVAEDKQNRLATGFSDGADMPNWSGFDALAGAGALVSSARDLLRFVQHNVDNKDRSKSIAALQQRQSEGTTALGWHVSEFEGDELMLWHNGGTGGYSSFLAVRPDAGTGVVILAASTAATDVTDLGMAQITGRPRSGDAEIVEAFSGAYELADGFILTVYSEDGRLFGQATGQAAFPLRNDSDDTFSFAAAEIKVKFLRDEHGEVNAMQFSQAGSATTAPKVGDEHGIQRREEIAINGDALRDFAGSFKLAPGAIFTIEARGDQLYVQLTGQQSLPVFPFEVDKFFYKVVDAELHFERDQDDRVIAVTLHQAGSQRAPRIE